MVPVDKWLDVVVIKPERIIETVEGADVVKVGVMHSDRSTTTASTYRVGMSIKPSASVVGPCVVIPTRGCGLTHVLPTHSRDAGR
jgi:hypothetical protein